MTAPLWTARLPYPPSINAYYENRRMRTPNFLKGGKVNPKAGKQFMGRMIGAAGLRFRQEVHAAVRAGHRAPPRLVGRLAIVVLLLPPAEMADGRANRNRRDIGNVDKALEDALTHAGVIGDDSQFDDVRYLRGNPVKGGEAWVAIRPFDPSAVAAAGLDFGLAAEADLFDHGR